MNKIYKLIWSKVKNMWVAVAEIAKSHTKSPRSFVIGRTLVAGVLACVLGFGVAGPVWAAGDASKISSSNNNTVTGADVYEWLTKYGLYGASMIGTGSISSYSSIGIGFGARVGAVTNNSVGYSVAIGNYALTTGSNSTSIGSNAIAYGYRSVAIGADAQALTSDAFANDDSGKSRAVAIGAGSKAMANLSVAIGDNAVAEAGKAWVVSIGANSYSGQLGSFASGYGAKAFGKNGVAMGRQATAGKSANGSLRVDPSSEVKSKNDTEARNTVAIGYLSLANEDNAIALGYKTEATGINAIALGSGTANTDTDFTDSITRASGQNSIAFGFNARAANQNSIAIGYDSQVTGEESIAIGSGHRVAGNHSGTFGDPNIVNADNSYVVGNNSTVAANTKNVFVLGNDVNVNNGTATTDTAVAEGVIALGNNASVSLDNKVTASRSSDSTGNPTVAHSVAIGDNAVVGEENAMALGYQAQAKALNALASGSNAQALSEGAAAIGHNAKVNENSSFATVVGYDAEVTGEAASAFGYDATAGDKFATAFGRKATASAEAATAIGNDAKALSQQAVAIGGSALVNGGANTNAVAIGRGATVGSDTQGYGETVAIGGGANVQNYYSTAVGSGASVTGENSVALGAGSTATVQNVVSVGKGTTGGDTPATRRIINVTDGTSATDAATVGQVRTVSQGNGIVLTETTNTNGSKNEAIAVKAGTNVTVDTNGVNVLGNGAVAEGNTGIVDGGTVYSALQAQKATTDTALTGKANVALDNVTEAGHSVIKSDAKSAVNAVAGIHTTIAKTDVDGVDTYAVNVTTDGTVTDGNTGIVTGGTVYTALNNEKTAREAADTTLQGNIDAEATTRQSADTALQESITAEQTARTTADTALSDRIGTLSADGNYIRQANDVSQNLSVLDSAVNTLSDGKADIALSNINNDGKSVVRSLAKESVKVVAGTYTTVTEGVDGEAKTYAVNVTADGVISENDIGLVNGGTVYTALNTEKTAREMADTTLQGNIDTEATTRGNEDTRLAGLIAAEETARQGADTTLQTNITAEETARIAEDTALSDRIGTLSADGNYIRQANNVSQNLGALDAQLKTNTDGLASEVTARTNADIALSGRIGVVAADGTYIKSSETKNVAENLSLLDTGLAKEVTDRTAAVTAEKTAREAADTALSGRIGMLSADGSYVRQANNVNQNLSALDTAVNNLSDGKADISLSNIDNAGKTVVRNLAKESVKVVDGTYTTVTEGTDGDAKTYAVNVTADGVVENNNTGLVTGGTVYTAVNAEKTAREAADTVLQGNIDAEATARGNEDTRLAGLITSEESARIAADTALSERVGTVSDDGNYILKTNDVSQNLSVLDTQVKANADDLADEVTARENADTALSERVTTNTNNIATNTTDITNLKDLSNITDTGKTVIKNLSKGSVNVVGSGLASVTKTNVESVDTYTVGVVADGEVVDGNTKLVNGGTVHTAIQNAIGDLNTDIQTSLNGKANIALDNVTDAGHAIIKSDAKAALNVVGGNYATVDKTDVNGVDTYTVNVATDGAVVDGNTKLVTGATVYQAIQDAKTELDTKIANGTAYFSVNSTETPNRDGKGATGVDAMAIGDGASASGNSSAALGDYADAKGLRSIALGNSAGAEKDYGIAIGGLAKVKADGGIAMGTSANVTGTNAVALGNSAKAEGATSYAIGQGADAKGESSIAFGTSSESATTGVAMGHMAKATGESGVALGTATNAGKTAVAVGHGANAGAEAAMALGVNSSATQPTAVAIGMGSTATEANTVSFGNASTKRRVVNIAEGVADNDAVAMSQLNALEETVNDGLDAKANLTLNNIDNAGKTVVRDLAKESVKVVNGTHTTVTEGTDGNAKTYAVNVTTDGEVSQNNTGIVTGGTVYDAVHAEEESRKAADTALSDRIGTLSADGNYIGKDNAVSSNLSALDTQLKSNTDTIATHTTDIAGLKDLSNITDAGKNVIKSYAKGSVNVTGSGKANVTKTDVSGVDTYNVEVLANGAVADGNTDIVSGGAVHTAIENAKTELSEAISNSSAKYFGVKSAGGYESNEHGEGAIGDGSVAIGTSPMAMGNNSIAVGAMSATMGDGSVAVGNSATALTDGAVAIGKNAQSPNEKTVAIGDTAVASGKNSVALGANADTNNKANSVALGSGSVATDENAVSVGNTETKRRVVNVAKGTVASDAAVVEQTLEVVDGLNSKVVADGTNTIGQKKVKINVEGLGTVAENNTALINGGTMYTELRPTDGTYVKNTNTTASNLSALDTQVKTNTDDITNLKDLSNITDAGKTVIKDFAKGAVSVTGSGKATVTKSEVNGVDIYNVNVTANGTVTEGNTDIVTGGTVHSAIQNAIASSEGDMSTALAGKANVALDNLTEAGHNVVKADAKSAVNVAGGNYATVTKTDENGVDTYTVNVATDGEIADGNDKLVTGGTVYTAINNEKTARENADTALSDRIGTLTDDGNYVSKDASVADNLVTLDTQLKSNTDTINTHTTDINGLKDLSNITTAGENVIRELSKGSVNVIGYGLATVSKSSTGNMDTYTVRVTANGAVAEDNEGIVTGGDVYDAIDVAVNEVSNVVGIKANADASNIGRYNAGGDNASQWGAALGTDAIEMGNFRLVTSQGMFEELRPTNGSYITGDKSVAENLSQLDTQVKTNADTISDLAGTVVRYDSADKESVTLGTPATAKVKVTNVAEGTLSATSTDAVNGSQLYQTNQAVNKEKEERENADTEISNRIGTIPVDGEYTYISKDDSVSSNLTALDRNLKSVSDSISSFGDLGSLTDTGRDVIRTLSKESVKVIDGTNTTVTKGTDGNADTYAVNVTVDGSVTQGNEGLVKGGDIYEAIQSAIASGTPDALISKANTDLSNLNNDGKNEVRNLAKDAVNVKGENGINVTQVTSGGPDGVTKEFTATLLKATGVEQGNANVVDSGTMFSELRPADGDYVAQSNTTAQNLSALDTALKSVNDTVEANYNSLNGAMGTKMNVSLSNITDSGKETLRKIARSSVKVESSDGSVDVEASNVDVYDAYGSHALYDISVKKDGAVVNGNTGIVTGGTVAAETRVATDGEYVRTANSAGENIRLLDTALKSVADLAQQSAEVGRDANAVHYDSVAKDTVSLAGADGTVITNLKDGAVSADSKDAVTGKQLYGVKETAEQAARDVQSLHDTVGDLQDGSYISSSETVGNNLKSLDTQVKSNTDALNSLQQGQDGINSSINELRDDMDDKADTDLGNLSNAGKDVIRNLVGDAVDVVSSDNTLSVSTSTTEGVKTFDLSVKKDGEVVAGNTGIVTGGTVYEAIQNVTVSDERIRQVLGDFLDTKADAGLGNLTEEGKDVIRETVRPELDKKANVDASNIDVQKWTDTLGTGKVEEGNGNLVRGGEVYDAIRKIDVNNGMIQSSDGVVRIGANDASEIVDFTNSEGSGRVLRGVVTDISDKTSAANVGYVDAMNRNVLANVNDGLSRMDKKINKVGAGAAAMASLAPMPFDSDQKWSISAAVGTYKGETSGAIGAFYRPLDNVMLNIRGAVGNGENMAGAGVTIGLNKGGATGLSKAQMVRAMNAQANEIVAQKEMIQSQQEQLKLQKQQIEELKAMFEDMKKAK